MGAGQSQIGDGNGCRCVVCGKESGTFAGEMEIIGRMWACKGECIELLQQVQESRRKGQPRTYEPPLLADCQDLLDALIEHDRVMGLLWYAGHLPDHVAEARDAQKTADLIARVKRNLAGAQPRTYEQGAEDMRERAARAADYVCSNGAGSAIRALPTTPKED